MASTSTSDASTTSFAAVLATAALTLGVFMAEAVALALSRADDQRIGHHLVGAVFAAAAFQVSAATYEEYKRFFWGFAVVVQGGSVFTKAVQLRRALAPAAA